MRFQFILFVWGICLLDSVKSEEKMSNKDKFSSVIESYRLLLHKKIKLPDFTLTFDKPQISITSGFTRGEDQIAKFNYKDLSLLYFNGRYYLSGKRFDQKNHNSLFYRENKLFVADKELAHTKHDEVDIKYLSGYNTGAKNNFIDKRKWSKIVFKYKTQGLPISLNYTPIKDGEFHYSLFWISGEIRENQLYIFGKKIGKIEKESFFDFSSDKLFIDQKFIGNISELIK